MHFILITAVMTMEEMADMTIRKGGFYNLFKLQSMQSAQRGYISLRSLYNSVVQKK